MAGTSMGRLPVGRDPWGWFDWRGVAVAHDDADQGRGHVGSGPVRRPRGTGGHRLRQGPAGDRGHGLLNIHAERRSEATAHRPRFVRNRMSRNGRLGVWGGPVDVGGNGPVVPVAR